MDDGTNLKKPENGVQIRRAGNEAKFAVFVAFRLAEPAKKQEHVADAHPVVLQVSLCRAVLAQRRAPTGRSGCSCGFDNVGICVALRGRMGAFSSPQFVQYGVEADAVPLERSVVTLVHRGRNGQTYKRSVREYGAGDPTVLGIEPFATQDDLHVGRLIGRR